MIKLIHKNFASLLLVIIFFMAVFGAGAETASAATYPSTSPSQISIDLSDWLLNGATYSIDIQPTAITGVRAIPSDLYTPEHQWQADKIISNIEKNPVVINRVKEAALAKSACDAAVLTCLLGLPSDELTALNKAMDALMESLVVARDAQDSTIQGYQAQNMADEAINDKYSTYSDIASSSDAGISAINQIDIGNASQAPGITQEQIEASRLAQQNASAWNTDDSVAIKMQENCSIGVFGEMNLTPCVAEVVYKVIYKPTAYALMGAGYIFDQILSLSIEGVMVAPPFINSTWKVVRDFSNMIFIFVLLYTGVQTILGIGGWQKTIRNVIIIALLINFSLFFTKVVIDAGNVLAVGVKSAISTTSVSEGLAAAFQPQQFLNAATKGPDTSGGDAIIVFLVAAAVSIFAAYIFFKAALLFMGRLIAFWGLMIISPFAFISMAMPKGNIFNDWLDMLVKQSFVAPVFLFFVYIIMKVISGGTGILGGFTQTGDWFKDLLGPVIVATLLILALKQALDIATDMSGKMGKLGSDMVGKVIGATAVVATGGAGFVGQKTIGRAALAAVGSDKFKAFAAKSPLGRVAYELTDKTANATFDVRNAPMGDKLGLGKGGSGSFVKTVETAKKEDVAFGKKIATDKDGKPITTKFKTTETTTGPSGEKITREVEKEGTTTETYAAQLGKGYITRVGTGGNIGAEQAAKELGKKEEKRKKLAKKEKDTTDNYKKELGIKEGDPEYKLDLDHPEIEAKKEETLNNLELKVAQTEADLEYLKSKDPGDTSTIAMAIVSKKKAEKALKKFENTKSEIEKIQQEIKKLGEEKEEKKEKKEEKKDEEKH